MSTSTVPEDIYILTKVAMRSNTGNINPAVQQTTTEAFIDGDRAIDAAKATWDYLFAQWFALNQINELALPEDPASLSHGKIYGKWNQQLTPGFAPARTLHGGNNVVFEEGECAVWVEKRLVDTGTESRGGDEGFAGGNGGKVWIEEKHDGGGRGRVNGDGGSGRSSKGRSAKDIAEEGIRKLTGMDTTGDVGDAVEAIQQQRCERCGSWLGKKRS